MGKNGLVKRSQEDRCARWGEWPSKCPKRKPALATMPYLEIRGGMANDGNSEEGDQGPRLPGGATPEPGERRQDEAPS